MAKYVPSQAPRVVTPWQIVTPGPQQVVPLNPDNTVTVVVADENSGNTGYLAAIYSGSAPSPPMGPNYPGYTPLASNDGGATWSWNVPVNFAGSFQSQQNVVVYPLTSLANPQTNPFSLSVSGVGSGLAGGVATNCCTGVLVPVWLYAHVSSGGAMNGVYTLVFDPNTNAWVSAAICGSSSFRLLCAAPKWTLSGWTATIFTSASSSCSPFQIQFNNVDLSTCTGGTAGAAVEILVSPGLPPP